MPTVGILYPAVSCRIYIICILRLPTHGMIYVMRGLSAVVRLDSWQCEGLEGGMGNRRIPTLFRIV